MGRAFQFVDHRDGVILNRNPALAGSVYQELVVSEAELSRALSGRQVCRRAQIGPFKFRLFSQLVQSVDRRQSTWLYPERHIRVVDKTDSRCDLQPARSAHPEHPFDSRFLNRGDNGCCSSNLVEVGDDRGRKSRASSRGLSDPCGAPRPARPEPTSVAARGAPEQRPHDEEEEQREDEPREGGTGLTPAHTAGRADCATMPGWFSCRRPSRARPRPSGWIRNHCESSAVIPALPGVPGTVCCEWAGPRLSMPSWPRRRPSPRSYQCPRSWTGRTPVMPAPCCWRYCPDSPWPSSPGTGPSWREPRARPAAPCMPCWLGVPAPA